MTFADQLARLVDVGDVGGLEGLLARCPANAPILREQVLAAIRSARTVKAVLDYRRELTMRFYRYVDRQEAIRSERRSGR